MDFRNFLSASGKISLTKTKNRETRAQRLHQWWKNRYFLLLFSSSSVTTGSSIVPVENATTWYPEKKEKKKEGSQEDSWNKSFAECTGCFHFVVDPFISDCVDFLYLTVKLVQISRPKVQQKRG